MEKNIFILRNLIKGNKNNKKILKKKLIGVKNTSRRNSGNNSKGNVNGNTKIKRRAETEL